MLLSPVGTGDVDGDGKPDTAAVLAYNGGGTGTFYYLAAVLSSTNAPTNTVLLGDRIAVTQLSVSAKTITVNYLTRPADAPLAATPSVSTSKSFVVTGGKLVPK
jgi:hypothetical protein